VTGSPYSARPWLQHYDYWVPPHLVYPTRPLHDILDTAAVEAPDRPATAFLGATLTFREIKDRSDRLATVLARMDVARGDRVGIMLPNCPQYLIAAFAILRLGAVVVNINPTYTTREVQTIAADAGLRVFITLDTLASLALDLRTVTPLERIIITSVDEYSGPGAAPPLVEGTTTLAHAIASVAVPEIFCTPIEPDDVAVLQYTGGTTGAPKSAMLTHRNIFANVVQTEAFMYRSKTRGESRYLMVIPFFHIYAFTVGMMKGVWVGALQVLIPKYEPALVLAAIREFRPTYFPAVPTVFMSLLQHLKIKEHGLENVRIFNTGGAPCPVEVIARWERTVGRPLNQGYGLTETSPVTHSTPQLARRKPGTIGLPLPDTGYQDRGSRHRRARAAARGSGCALHLRTASDEGLLAPPRRKRQRAAHGRGRPRVVPHRRRCADGRRRLHDDRPAQEGHDHRGRLQRLPVGGRGGDLRAPRGPTRCRRRDAGCVSRRIRQGVCCPQGGPRRGRGANP
jgi:long-chain acyl-CoA synthetase